MSESSAQKCPEPLRKAFLDLLTGTLLGIRSEPGDALLCFALSDHMHNVPALLAGFPTLMRELAKCDLVCNNCHAIRTHSRKAELAGV